MNFKRGDQVLVCDDGKASRGKIGVVIKTIQDRKVLVRYKPHYHDDKDYVTEQWFKVYEKCRGIKRFGNYVSEDLPQWPWGMWCGLTKPKKLLGRGYEPYWENEEDET